MTTTEIILCCVAYWAIGEVVVLACLWDEESVRKYPGFIMAGWILWPLFLYSAIKAKLIDYYFPLEKSGGEGE